MEAEKLFLNRFFVVPKPIWSAFGCDIFFAGLQKQINTVVIPFLLISFIYKNLLLKMNEEASSK